jgi:hypothetical protein
MAEVRKIAGASLATKTPCDAHNLTGLRAGEDFAEAGFFCYIDDNDTDAVKKATGAAADNAAVAVGVNAAPASDGEAITIHHGVRYHWCAKSTQGGGTGPAAGTLLYLSGTNAGELADAPSTGGTVPIAYVCDDAGRIQLIPFVPFPFEPPA